jgi:hypothetical protein
MESIIKYEIEKLRDLTAKVFKSLKKGHTSGFNRGPYFSR